MLDWKCNVQTTQKWVCKKKTKHNHKSYTYNQNHRQIRQYNMISTKTQHIDKIYSNVVWYQQNHHHILQYNQQTYVRVKSILLRMMNPNLCSWNHNLRVIQLPSITPSLRWIQSIQSTFVAEQSPGSRCRCFRLSRDAISKAPSSRAREITPV